MSLRDLQNCDKSICAQGEMWILNVLLQGCAKMLGSTKEKLLQMA